MPPSLAIDGIDEQQHEKDVTDIGPEELEAAGRDKITDLPSSASLKQRRPSAQHPDTDCTCNLNDFPIS